MWSVIEWDGLIGTAANEKLIGTNGDDTIDGAAGNDRIIAGDGNDVIYAGDGNDQVNAGSGNNIVIAETTDTDSSDGNDRFIAGDGNDFLASGTGNDNIKAGNGDNTVIGGSGDDKIITGAGNDTIDIDGYYAEDGIGASGNDIIKSGAGNDYIVLGEGYDKVWGGGGSDTFLLNVLPESTVTSTTTTSSGATKTTYLAHRINDFDAGHNFGTVDLLNLDSTAFSALGTSFSANNFVKGKGLHNAPTQATGVDDYLIYDTASGHLYYDADGNATESEAILIAIVKGKMTDFNIEDIAII